MKKFLISAMMLLATMSASAQLISAARDNDGVKFGVRGSFALSNMNQEIEKSVSLGSIAGSTVSSKQLPAFAVGVAMDLPVLESFHFNIELKYAMKGQKYVEQGSLLGKNHEVTSVTRIGYVEMPIQPQFRLNLSDAAHVNVNVGPYLGFAVSGNTKTTTHVEDLKDQIAKQYIFTGKSFTKDGDNSRNWNDAANDYEAPLTRFDVGLAMGVDFVIEHFHIGVSYDAGLKDINSKAQDMKGKSGYNPVKNRTAMFTLGIDF